MLLCVNFTMKYTNAFVCQYYNEVYKCIVYKYTNAFVCQLYYEVYKCFCVSILQ